MLLSATQLDEARHCYAFSYRAALYLSMTVLFLYVFNLPAAVPAWRNVLALTLFWATVICLGFAALAAPRPGSAPRWRRCCPRTWRPAASSRTWSGARLA